MADRILIDTNVLLDYLLTREPFITKRQKLFWPVQMERSEDVLQHIPFQICSLF